MQKRIVDHRRRVARLNRCVVVVALLWLAASFALLFLSAPGPARVAHPTSPGWQSALHARAALPGFFTAKRPARLSFVPR